MDAHILSGAVAMLDRLILFLIVHRNILEKTTTGTMDITEWAKMTKTSRATALRDITDLMEKGILVAAEDGGRSSNYLLKDGNHI